MKNALLPGLFFSPFGLLIGLVLVAGGCSKNPIVPVSGRVTIDGKPVSGGFIRFIPTGARAAAGQIDKQGRFSLTTYKTDDGCVVGSHHVEILAKEFPSDTQTKWLVPKKYAQMETSGLVYEIKGPTADLAIQLTWAGGEPLIEESRGQGDAPVILDSLPMESGGSPQDEK